MSDQEEGNSNINSVTSITSVKRQRNGNKLYVKRVIDESHNIIAATQEVHIDNSVKVKLTANRDILVSKLALIKSYDEKILDTICFYR